MIDPLNLPEQDVQLESDVHLDWDGGRRLQPEDRAVSLWVRSESVLELVQVGLVGQIEVRPGHVHRGLHLTLGHILKAHSEYTAE